MTLVGRRASALRYLSVLSIPGDKVSSTEADGVPEGRESRKQLSGHDEICVS